MGKTKERNQSFSVKRRAEDGQTIIVVEGDSTINEVPAIIYSEDDFEKIIQARKLVTILVEGKSIHLK